MEKVTIALNGEFSASDLEEILRDLAAQRADMAPAVPVELSPDAEVLEETDALFSIRTRLGGGLRIWLRHTGFGWIPFSLSAATRADLREWLGRDPGHGQTFH